MTSEEIQDFSETIRENLNLYTIYKKCGTPLTFLTRSDKIYARSASLDEVERDAWLQFRTDIDGCVLEINNLSGINMPVRHITIFPLDNGSLKEVKNILKKHIDLISYSHTELCNFNKSVGFQLFYERGWGCWIAMIPSHQEGSVLLSKELIRQKSYSTFLEFRTRLQRKLMSYSMEGIASRTLFKNDLSDIRKLFILPDDCRCILSAVQTTLEGLSMSGFRSIVFCFRFGEKMTHGLSLDDFDREVILKATVHAAIDIATDCGIDLFWSTGGLHDVTGERGTLSTCLSFIDCGNFQSNLDGRPMDIKPIIRRVCRFPENLKFVQMYSDLPHRQPKSRFHPVSGCVAGGMCFARPTAEAFFRDATRYVSTLKTNWILMKKSTCRLEFVVEQGLLSDIVHGNDFIDLSNLEYLLEKKALLVPFPPQVLSSIRHLGFWIAKELETTLLQYKNTGNIKAIWYSYQLELASEKLLWGRPLCNRSIPYSVNLGPGILCGSRSVTDHLGFLAVESYSSCMHTDDSIPPYQLWTMSEVTGKSMIRAAGFHDHLDASYNVIGRRLVSALLKDLHEVGGATAYSRYEDFLTEMISHRIRYRTVGAVTHGNLVKILCMKRRTVPQMVFPALCQLIQKTGVSIAEVLMAGFHELNLRFFPAVKTYDRHGNITLTWSFKDNFWTVVGDKESSDNDQSSLEKFSDLVRGELDRNGLVYASKAKKTPKVLPWVDSCLRKIKRENLSIESIVTTLTYISCVAFMMQGWFVEFDLLARTQIELPIKLNKLQGLEILSKLELPNFKFRQLKLYRLHHSIPHQLPLLQQETQCVVTEENVNNDEQFHANNYDIEENTMKIGDDDENLTIIQNIDHRRQPTCQPVKNIIPHSWSGEELEILHDISLNMNGGTLKQMYENFKTQMHKFQNTFSYISCV